MIGFGERSHVRAGGYVHLDPLSGFGTDVHGYGGIVYKDAVLEFFSFDVMVDRKLVAFAPGHAKGFLFFPCDSGFQFDPIERPVLFLAGNGDQKAQRLAFGRYGNVFSRCENRDLDVGHRSDIRSWHKGPSNGSLELSAKIGVVEQDQGQGNQAGGRDQPFAQSSQGQGASHVERPDSRRNVLLHEIAKNFRIAFHAFFSCQFHGREKIFPELRRGLLDQAGEFSATGQLQQKPGASAPNGENDDGVSQIGQGGPQLVGHAGLGEIVGNGNG